MRVGLLCCAVLLVSACSGEGESEHETIVTEDHKGMINKAKNVEAVVGEAGAQQRQRIETQMQ